MGRRRRSIPRFNPATAVTLGVSGQGVDVLDPPGTTEPPVVTTTGTNLFFIQQPTAADVGTAIAPPVSMRVFDNNGAPLPAGVPVIVSLLNAPAGVVLSGTVSALTTAGGIATFANLAVSGPAAGLRLKAEATFPGGTAAGVSEPFDVGITAPTNLFFIQQPTSAAVGAPIAPPVSVRVLDNNGGVIPGVFVSMSLVNPPVGVLAIGHDHGSG